MAMMTNTLELKPFADKKFNWGWLAQRAPIFVLSIESAANIYGYLILTKTHPLISLIGSIGFDAIFIGLVALSDQIRELEVDEQGKIVKGRVDHLFWLINLGALLFSFLGALLYHSGGTYAAATPESFTRAIIFPALSLLYTLYFDRKMKQIKVQTEKIVKEFPLECEYCGQRYRAEEIRRLNGHKAQCSKKPRSNAATP